MNRSRPIRSRSLRPAWLMTMVWICWSVSGCQIHVHPTTDTEVPSTAAEPSHTRIPAGERAGNGQNASQDGLIAPRLQDLGSYARQINTSHPLAQRYFNQGLNLAYAFNHGEAARSFAQATVIDPNCPMPHWGIALVNGPNINKPMSPEDGEKAYHAIQKALSLRDHASPVNRQLIDALATRYTPGPAPGQARDNDSEVGGDPEITRTRLDRNYAHAMARIAQRSPDDPDVTTLYAAALMNLNAWNYWTPDGHPRENTETLVSTLERTITDHPDHPGAHHYYIHAVEASQNPARALPSAKALEHLVPGAGHLVHMPSHIYLRVGRYRLASDANRRAIEVDEDYITQCRAQGFYPAAYYPHNVHFLWASTTLEGNSAQALAAGRKLTTTLHAKDHDLRARQQFNVAPYYTMVRFAKWDQILNEPAPPTDFLFATGMWHYARGMAYTAKNRIDLAQKELDIVTGIADHPDLLPELLFVFSPPKKLITLAAHHLAGEIALARGEHALAVAHFDSGVRLEDSIPYNEPSDWSYPMRHALGYALLQINRPVQAEVVYWEDLRRHPENGWSLFGLMQALQAQGDHRDKGRTEIEQRFEQAWNGADVTLSSSRY